MRFKVKKATRPFFKRRRECTCEDRWRLVDVQIKTLRYYEQTRLNKRFGAGPPGLLWTYRCANPVASITSIRATREIQR